MLHYGMIATGNHGYFDSLRDAPPRRALAEVSGENFAVRYQVSMSLRTSPQTGSQSL